MQQDTFVFAGILFQIGIENDDTSPDKRRRVCRIARRVAEIRAVTDFNRTSLK